ncbi:MAG: hypothetical protein FWH38_07145, partial [Treponema sp.]|nr:hypothetical protein [Treponema sp.]
GGIRGIQAAGVGNYSGGVVTGLQAAGIGNLSMGSVQGIQAAGIFNYANELQGAQAAGIVNINRGGNGAMFGLVNISQSEDVVPFGLVNVIKNGILRPSVYIDDMLFTNFSFRSGSKHFYSIFSFGFGGELFFNRADDRFFSARAGFGFEYAVNKLFFDIDLTGGSIVNRNAAEAAFNNETGDFDYRSFDSDAFSGAFTSAVQLRLTVGFNFFEHFGVFGGISYDYFNKYNARSPVPADFGGLMAGRVNGPDCHKLGIFAGIQY